MANQITIDIVAQTSKLTSGINEANGQIDGMSSKLKGAAAAAGAAASAFVLKQGVTFLKQGIDEAKEAAETMRAATTTFGEGSAALAKITEDADKFGKAIAVDNDVIIQLATQLGSRLPADSKALSAELVNLAFDVEAFTGGAVAADAVTGKLAKAFADGQLKATELTKIFPDLEESVYAQAEALSKAGDNQGALNLLVDAGQKKYGEAAESNVTSSQKFDKALADLKETIGGKLLDPLNKLVDFLTKAIEAFSNLPGPVQNVIIGLTALVGVGGLALTFLASMKASLVTLGIINGTTAGSIGLVTIATNLLKIALAGIGIAAVIALIVLLVQNWDDITAAVDRVWEKIKDVVPKAWAKVMEFKDKVVGFVGEIVKAYLSIPGKMLGIGQDIVEGLWNGIKGMMSWIQNKIENSFVGKIIGQVNNLFGRKSPSKVFAGIGKDLVKGLWVGVSGQKTFIEKNFDDFFSEIIPDLSTSLNLPDFTDFVTIDYLTNAVESSSVDQSALAGMGLDWNAVTEQFDIDDTVITTAKLADLLSSDYSIPSLNESGAGTGTYNITINAGAGSDPYSVGRAVTSAIDKYSRISSATGQRVTL
jgi:hypothetical protein